MLTMCLLSVVFDVQIMVQIYSSFKKYIEHLHRWGFDKNKFRCSLNVQT